MIRYVKCLCNISSVTKAKRVRTKAYRLHSFSSTVSQCLTFMDNKYNSKSTISRNNLLYKNYSSKLNAKCHISENELQWISFTTGWNKKYKYFISVDMEYKKNKIIYFSKIMLEIVLKWTHKLLEKYYQKSKPNSSWSLLQAVILNPPESFFVMLELIMSYASRTIMWSLMRFVNNL